MTPEQAINAATVNAALAMESANDNGSISIGAKANLLFFKPKVKALSYLSYSFGEEHIEKVMVNGEFL